MSELMKCLRVVILILVFTSCSKDMTRVLSRDILLDGASFASDINNSWFRYLCEDLSIHGYNKAIPGSSIKDTAQRIHDGKLYSLNEMENFGIFMLMHVHNENVYEALDIPSNVYDEPFCASNLSYSQAYYYVLKKYREDCYNLKFNPGSQWYNSPNGKPCIIVCLTHWHDAREIFNSSIRLLQNEFQFYLCEVDKNIGFSKYDNLFSQQASLLYSVDTEYIDGVEYGWHMENDENEGKRCYIQDRVSQIVKSLIIYIYSNKPNYLS